MAGIKIKRPIIEDFRPQMTRIKETLAELVRIDSVSSEIERGDNRLSSNVAAQAMQLKTRRFPYKDDHGIEKINLIALTADVRRS